MYHTVIICSLKFSISKPNGHLLISLCFREENYLDFVFTKMRAIGLC